VTSACGRIAFDPIAGGAADASGDAACTAVTGVDWLGGKVPRDAVRNYAVSAGGDVVLDMDSGLSWQRTVTATLYLPADAVTYCASLSLDGCSQWRLPERVELATLIDHTFASPAIDPTAFPATPIDTLHWTASPATSSGNQWAINFANGNTFWDVTTSSYHVRCVHSERAGDLPLTRYNVTANTVVDLDTTLEWTRAIDPSTETQINAAQYCDLLATDGGGWRLPEISELTSILDSSRTTPAIDPTAFPGTPSALFWSASPYLSVGMEIDFTGGTTINAATTDLLNVRCVR
jgi:hypothetical protein